METQSQILHSSHNHYPLMLRLSSAACQTSVSSTTVAAKRTMTTTWLVTSESTALMSIAHITEFSVCDFTKHVCTQSNVRDSKWDYIGVQIAASATHTHCNYKCAPSLEKIYHSKFIVTYAFHWQELHSLGYSLHHRSWIYGTKIQRTRK